MCTAVECDSLDSKKMDSLYTRNRKYILNTTPVFSLPGAASSCDIISSTSVTDNRRPLLFMFAMGMYVLLYCSE